MVLQCQTGLSATAHQKKGASDMVELIWTFATEIVTLIGRFINQVLLHRRYEDSNDGWDAVTGVCAVIIVLVVGCFFLS